MASRKQQREEARQERLAREQEAAAAARRKRMTQLGVGGLFLAALIVGVAIAVSQSGGGIGRQLHGHRRAQRSSRSS